MFVDTTTGSKRCVASCGAYQTADALKTCMCKDGLERDPNSNECVLPDEKIWRDFADICATEGRVVSFTGNKCDESCGENEAPNDKKVCVCDSESIIHEDGTRCIKKSKCQRAIEKDGTTVCLASETCPEGTKLSTDGQLCTTSCDLWTEDELTKEPHCVDTCPGWWYRSENGLCVEEKWRKSTAIAVPVVVVVILAGIVLTIVIIRKKTKAKAAKKEPEKEMRDHVTNA